VTRRTIWTAISVLILAMVLNTNTVRAHGKVAIEDDSCMRRIGENMIHLSTYQPQVDEEGHYCTDIPKAGNTIMVIDLVDPSLRDIPIGIKVIKGNRVEDGETVKDIRPTLYEDGVISTQDGLEQGQYLVLVTAEGVPPLRYEYHLRVEMINYAEVFRASIGPIVALLLTTLLGYKLFKSKRFRSWLAARGSQKD